MTDPLQKIEQPRRGTLFDDTSRLAGEAAARSVGSRREKIIRFLRERGPATLFEIASHLGYYDHQISGRFTELQKDGLIERTGERRAKPETGCVADVWKLRDEPAAAGRGDRDRGDAQGYPQELVLPGDGRFLRYPVMDDDGAPGIPYTIHNDAAGLRLSYRVALIECEGCGKPLKMAQVVRDGKPGKVYRCGSPGCNRAWHLQLVHEPGGAELLALVLKLI